MMVFSRAICPGFTITTNGQTGFLQAVGKIFISWDLVLAVYFSIADFQLSTTDMGCAEPLL
jgi:hypothetical protein